MEAFCCIPNRPPSPALIPCHRAPSLPRFSLSSHLSRSLPFPPLTISDPDCTDPHQSSAWLSHVFRSVWLGLVLQWSITPETRRSFITGILRQHASRFVDRSSASLVSPQLVTMTIRKIFTRRVALMTPFLATMSAACGSKTTVARAEDFKVERSFLQNLGIGDADIYYPRFFEGSWICDSTLVALDTPQGEDKADKKSVEFSRKQLGYTVRYKDRFIPFGKNIIGDRLFTTLSLVESTVGRKFVDHGIWMPEQPDRLTLVLRGGVKVQNFVTKRSASLSAPNQFDTSEYSQQIFDNASVEGGPPLIKASQNRTRYRWDTTAGDISSIEAFQRVSMFPVIQEGLSSMDIMSLDKPVTVYKYIIRFTRE